MAEAIARREVDNMLLLLNTMAESETSDVQSNNTVSSSVPTTTHISSASDTINSQGYHSMLFDYVPTDIGRRDCGSAIIFQQAWTNAVTEIIAAPSYDIFTKTPRHEYVHIASSVIAHERDCQHSFK